MDHLLANTDSRVPEAENWVTSSLLLLSPRSFECSVFVFVKFYHLKPNKKKKSFLYTQTKNQSRHILPVKFSMRHFNRLACIYCHFFKKKKNTRSFAEIITILICRTKKLFSVPNNLISWLAYVENVKLSNVFIVRVRDLF